MGPKEGALAREILARIEPKPPIKGIARLRFEHFFRTGGKASGDLKERAQIDHVCSGETAL